MWTRFSEEARRSIFYAQEAAVRVGTSEVSTELLLLGLLHAGDQNAVQVLIQMEVAWEELRDQMRRQVAVRDEHQLVAEAADQVWPPPPRMNDTQGKLRPDAEAIREKMRLTNRVKRVINLAYDEAWRMRHEVLGSEHLLLGILGEDKGSGSRLLSAYGADLAKARASVRQFHNRKEAKAKRHWWHGWFASK